MELLLYARNYRAAGPTTGGTVHRDLGVAVGDATLSYRRDEHLCSFIEVVLPTSVTDPDIEIELLVGKVFAAWGTPGAGRVIRFANARGRVTLALEPGFERARQLCQSLRPVLAEARFLLDRVHAGAAVDSPMPAMHRGPMLRVGRDRIRANSPLIAR